MAPWSAEPVLVNTSGDPAFHAMADSALRAIKRCAPFKIPAQYAPFYGDWQELEHHVRSPRIAGLTWFRRRRDATMMCVEPG